MFDRVKYKSLARSQLSGRWKLPVLVTLCMILVYALFYSQEMFRGARFSFNALRRYSYDVAFSQIFHPRHVGKNALLMVSSFFITAVTVIASKYTYLALSRTDEKLGFSVFLNGCLLWLEGFLCYLWYLLWTGLWGLLFWVPGVVKGFAYSQMFYIVAENPKISVRKAMRLSIVMTNGHKSDLFMMRLSFVGWDLLCLLTGGALVLFVKPYKEMAFANAYQALKQESLRRGLLSESDFC